MPEPPPPQRIAPIAPEVISIDGWEFSIHAYQGRSAPDGPPVLLKARWQIDRYAELAEVYPTPNIVEVGLYDGGSTVLLDLLFTPRKLLGIELDPRELPVLQNYLARARDGSRLRIATGTDQSDAPRLLQLVAAHFDGEPLDIVCDDASHLYGPTRASFEALFPLVRAGGVYIIEDWSSEHELEHRIRQEIAAGRVSEQQIEAAKQTPPLPRVPLSQLILELTALAASGDGAIERIQLRTGWVEVVRGDKPLDPSTFDIEESIGDTARSLLVHRHREM